MNKAVAATLMALSLFACAPQVDVASGRGGGQYDDGQTAASHNDFSTAFAIWLPLAENGNAKAQASIGTLYAQGLGVNRDYSQALIWLQKSADQGDADALGNLGVMYSAGTGVTKNSAEAANLYLKSAERGSARSAVNLGLAYYRGDGVPRDLAEADRWFQRAAAEGDPKGQQGLAMVRATGFVAPASVDTLNTQKTSTGTRDRSTLTTETERQQAYARLDQLMDGLLREDSKGWLVNRYVTGSVTNSRILEVSPKEKKVVILSEYKSFDSTGGNAANNGISRAAVKAVFINNKVSCFEYSDAFGICKKPGDLSIGVKIALLYGMSQSSGRLASSSDKGGDDLVSFASSLCHTAAGDGPLEIAAYGGNAFCN